MKKLNTAIIMKTIIMFLLLVSPIITKAETAAAPAAAQPIDVTAWLIIGLLSFIILVLLFLMYTLNTLFKYTITENSQESFWSSMIKNLTDTVPVEEESVILTDHVYDGIQELDNNLPPWWKYLFYATIVFAGVYLYYYHFSDTNRLQEAEYKQEMIVSEKEKEEYMKHSANSIDETNVKLADANGIANGKTIFSQNCAACHGGSGEGGVGPNLTDEYWLHGGGVKNVFKTIKYGVPQNGMISWKAQLSPSNIRDVASFVLSIQGTKPANGKAPQGDKYEEKSEVASN